MIEKSAAPIRGRSGVRGGLRPFAVAAGAPVANHVRRPVSRAHSVARGGGRAPVAGFRACGVVVRMIKDDAIIFGDNNINVCDSFVLLRSCRR